jgi:hypothetical protein
MLWLQAVLHGLIWSGLWIIGLLLIYRFYPHSLVHNYPKELQQLAHVPVKGTKKGYYAFMIPLWILIFGYYLFAVLLSFHNAGTDFLSIALFSFTIFMVWNTIDLVLLDWLMFCKIQPNFMVLKGTRGHPQYKNYLFHFIGFLKGIVIATVFSLVFGGVGYLILNFLIW